MKLRHALALWGVVFVVGAAAQAQETPKAPEASESAAPADDKAGTDPAAATTGDAPPAKADAPPAGATPPTDDVQVTPPDPSKRAQFQAFEYIEQLTVESQGRRFQVYTNVLVAVVTEGKTVTVHLRPDATRKPTNDEDPPPGRVQLQTGLRSESREYELEPRTVTFLFAPSEQGNVSIKGVSDILAAEAWAILGQGPSTNALKSESTIPYDIALISGRKKMTLNGEQRNKKLNVSWSLNRLGAVEVGEQGWQLPMEFHLNLPEQPVRRGRMKIEAVAGLTYSSVRVGPENETTLTSRLTLERGDQPVRYIRRCELRPSPALRAEDVTGEPAVLANAGGGADAWTRIVTLSTLGVQRLTGVRETGLAMWVAQLGIDGLRARELPRVQDVAARAAFKEAGRSFPSPDPSAVYRGSGVHGLGVRGGVMLPGAASGGSDFGPGPKFGLFWRPLSPRRRFGFEAEVGMAQVGAEAGSGSSMLITADVYGLLNLVRRDAVSVYILGGAGLIQELAEQNGVSESASLLKIEGGLGWRFKRRFDTRVSYGLLPDSKNIDSIIQVSFGILF